MIRKRVFLTIALAATLVATWALAQNQAARQGNQRMLVLRGGLLIDGTGGAPLQNSVVTIVNGKIQSVGTAGSVTIPADATVIDATGKTIMPGLVDSHMHLRNYHPQAYLYWGVTSAGDMGNPTGWMLAYRDAIAKGETPGPYIMAAGAKFNAPVKPDAPLAPGDSRGFATFLLGNSARVYVTDQASADTAAARVKKQGVDGIKLYTRMDPALMKITASAAHKQGLPVFAHYTSATNRGGTAFLGTDEIIDTGIDVHVHLFGLIKATAPKEIVDRIAKGENVQLPWNQMDTSKFLALAQKMVDKKMFLNPTLGAEFQASSKAIDDIVRLNAAFASGPIVAGIPEGVRTRYAGAYRSEGREATPQATEGYRRAGMFVKEFADRGGKIAAGTDNNGGNRTPGLSLHQEMRMLSEVGVKPMQVIQAATSWGAEAWGKANEVGTLQPGKRADILILNRNPLDDIKATTDIFRIIQGGLVIDREGLAKYQDIVPRPAAMQENSPNSMIHVPLIDEIQPELISANQKSTELIILGEGFTKDNLVLLNDRLIPVKSQESGEVTVTIPSGLFKKPGSYPLAVVHPGSAGGVSNTYYLIVTSK